MATPARAWALVAPGGCGAAAADASAAAAVTIYRSLCPVPCCLWLRPLRGRRNRIRMLRISSGDSARQSLAPPLSPPLSPALPLIL